jgi:hypothetical protein
MLDCCIPALQKISKGHGSVAGGQCTSPDHLKTFASLCHRDVASLSVRVLRLVQCKSTQVVLLKF